MFEVQEALSTAAGAHGYIMMTLYPMVLEDTLVVFYFIVMLQSISDQVWKKPTGPHTHIDWVLNFVENKKIAGSYTCLAYEEGKKKLQNLLPK